MNEETLQTTRKRLEERQVYLEAQIKVSVRPLGLGASKGEGDSSVLNEVEEERFHKLLLFKKEFSKNEAILARIKAGTYGTCRKCKGEVSEARLNSEAADTTTCTRCAEEEKMPDLFPLRKPEKRRVPGKQSGPKNPPPFVRVPAYK